MIANRKYLYLLSFLEGGAVMICELIGARMLAPFFGTSLYIWAAALGLTLGGLTTGYFLGGRLSRKYNNDQRLLFWILIAAGFFLTMMPIVSRWIMNLTIDFNLQTGAIISLLFFMFPPLVFMGMVSPVIINLLTKEVRNAGNSAGNVYAISTLGGILFTFLMGFYIIPEFGITRPAVIAGLVLASGPAISLIRAKNKPAMGSVFFMLLLGLLAFNLRQKVPDNYQVLYESEGILGQVKVVDHPSYEITPDSRMGRALIVNNTLQTYVGADHNYQYSIWSWANYFPTAASIFPKGSKVLLLGLGGGTIVKQFNRLGFDIEVVEIDKRIRDVSIKYFKMDPATKVIVDDARHYLKTTKKTYDIIVYDTFLSESVPEHLLTMEGFEDAKKVLKPGGMIMANFYGYINGEKGRAARSVLKTFQKSGLITSVLATPGSEESRNLIFLASQEEKDFSNADYEEPGFKKIESLYDFIITPSRIKTHDVEVLTDEKPRLSILYAQAAMQWKKSYNDYYRIHFFNKVD